MDSCDIVLGMRKWQIKHRNKQLWAKGHNLNNLKPLKKLNGAHLRLKSLNLIALTWAIKVESFVVSNWNYRLWCIHILVYVKWSSHNIIVILNHMNCNVQFIPSLLVELTYTFSSLGKTCLMISYGYHVSRGCVSRLEHC